ncbi:hypothetical protein LguiA_000251 [Lonicera macranthoides]
MEGERNRKRPQPIDWEKVFIEDDPPLELEVISTPVISNMGGGGDQQPPPRDDISRMTDTQLVDLMARQRRNIATLGPKLPDKGEKLKATLQRYQDENERRKNRRLEEDDDGRERTQHIGASHGFRQGAQSSSQFAAHFNRKLDENTDGRTVNAFEKELSSLTPCTRRKKTNGLSLPKGRHRSGLSSRQTPFQCPITISVDVEKKILSNGDQKGRHSSTCSPRHFEEDLSGSLSKRNASRPQHSHKLRPRNGQTVVLVDEEEPKLMETAQLADKVDDWLKDITIYYPSRDDPESIEISYSDMECLAPEAYLSSTIMNFYIRYLQQPTSPRERASCDYHFFNTYFYKKLKEAVMNKGDKETSFVKFRRWWKGVNIFEKAYILLPIHENLHWSLVIICIPDKEEESGPILLHLDSLGLHYSRSIFDNVKSFLKEEWNYLKGEAPSELPIADRIWQNLPRRIDDRIIPVPQQKNEYDCGLFVLFFMERFIEEAPERLKKQDLSMFGRQWFRPEEASGLRQKIRSLLIKEFKKQERTEVIPNHSPGRSTE